MGPPHSRSNFHAAYANVLGKLQPFLKVKLHNKVGINAKKHEKLLLDPIVL